MALSTNFDLTDEQLKHKTIDVDRITENKCNRIILTRLMNDDPSLTRLTLSSVISNAFTFNVTSVQEMAWLGYFVGKSTHLKVLELMYMSPLDSFDRIAKSFSEGASRNTSIEILTAGEINVFQMMGDEFFQYNHNLSDILVHGCPFKRQWSNMLSLTRSLKKVTFLRCQILDDDYANIMDALGGNTELEHLEFGGDDEIGRPGLAALLGLLKTSSKMKRLHLGNSGLNDEHILALTPILKESKLEYLSLICNFAITSQGWGILSEALVGHANLETLNLTSNSIADDGAIKFADALKKNTTLKTLDLVGNRAITSQGWGILSEALVGHATLETLNLRFNSIDDAMAIKFAGALKENTILKTLDLVGNEAITEVGWSAFADLLCSTSSIEKTLHSNHTLESLGFMIRGLPKRYLDLLEMNKNPNKKEVAMNKILKYHEDFDMTPLLEFGPGMLPAVVEWFDRARSCPRNFEANIDKKKLSAIYQFIKGNPEAPEQHWSVMP